MRRQPTWRIPLGVLTLVIMLGLYVLAVVRFVSPLITAWPGLGQVPIYLLFGVLWLAPLRRFVIWMETGRWR